MTREEAIIDLKAKITRIKAILDDGLCANLDRWAIKLKWHEDMLAALHSPQPDHITGLVPCEYCADTYDQKKLYYANNYEPHTCMESTIIITAGVDDMKHQIEVDLWDGGNAFAAFDINYCPMCGRKLTAPPRPGAIEPETDEMAPNGDEGATE